MTQSSRPQADNTANGYLEAGPYSRNQWAERLYAVYSGDENLADQRAQLRGVVPTFDNMLVVTTAAGDITVGTGAGFCGGTFMFNTAAVTFSPTHGLRTDYVVLVENNTNNIYNTNLQFPTVLVDYDATPAIRAYTARLAILTGPAVLVHTTDYWMVPLASYDIAAGGAVTNLIDRREFIDIETVVSTVALTNDEITDALILGVEVNDGVGANDLGVGIKFRLESAAGTTEDAGQLAIRYTDSTAADETRLELRLKAGGADHLAMVINAPAAATADGNARGAGAVDLQLTRTAVTEVASGNNAFIGGGIENTASGSRSAIIGGDSNQAIGAESVIAGGVGTVCNTGYSAILGGLNNVTNDLNAAVVGGTGNSATGANSAVTGGLTNVASGAAAVAVGGSLNDADGDYSLAAGRRAHTGANNGVFIWADSEDADFTADNADQFKVRASGGTSLVQNNNAAALTVLKLTQTDQDETFIDFVGTSAVDATKSISTMNTGAGAVDGPLSGANGWTFNSMVKVDVNGAPVWIATYTPV